MKKPNIYIPTVPKEYLVTEKTIDSLRIYKYDHFELPPLGPNQKYSLDFGVYDGDVEDIEIKVVEITKRRNLNYESQLKFRESEIKRSESENDKYQKYLEKLKKDSEYQKFLELKKKFE